MSQFQVFIIIRKENQNKNPVVSCRVIGALKLPNVLPVLEKLKPGVPVLGVLPNPVDVGFVPNPVVDVVPNPVPNVFVDG